MTEKEILHTLINHKIERIQEGLETFEIHSKLWHELEDYFRYEEFDEDD